MIGMSKKFFLEVKVAKIKNSREEMENKVEGLS
jgi:hypothetical protein